MKIKFWIYSWFVVTFVILLVGCITLWKRNSNLKAARNSLMSQKIELEDRIKELEEQIITHDEQEEAEEKESQKAEKIQQQNSAVKAEKGNGIFLLGEYPTVEEFPMWNSWKKAKECFIISDLKANDMRVGYITEEPIEVVAETQDFNGNIRKVTIPFEKLDEKLWRLDFKFNLVSPDGLNYVNFKITMADGKSLYLELKNSSI